MLSFYIKLNKLLRHILNIVRYNICPIGHMPLIAII